jgi:hypothetical protein
MVAGRICFLFFWIMGCPVVHSGVSSHPIITRMVSRRLNLVLSKVVKQLSLMTRIAVSLRCASTPHGSEVKDPSVRAISTKLSIYARDCNQNQTVRILTRN